MSRTTRPGSYGPHGALSSVVDTTTRRNAFSFGAIASSADASVGQNVDEQPVRLGAEQHRVDVLEQREIVVVGLLGDRVEELQPTVRPGGVPVEGRRTPERSAASSRRGYPKCFPSPRATASSTSPDRTSRTTMVTTNVSTSLPVSPAPTSLNVYALSVARSSPNALATSSTCQSSVSGSHHQLDPRPARYVGRLPRDRRSTRASSPSARPRPARSPRPRAARRRRNELVCGGSGKTRNPSLCKAIESSTARWYRSPISGSTVRSPSRADTAYGKSV